MVVAEGGTDCATAEQIVDTYYHNPPETPTGSSGSVRVGSWNCASKSARGTELSGVAGSCSSPAGNIRMDVEVAALDPNGITVDGLAPLELGMSDAEVAQLTGIVVTPPEACVPTRQQGVPEGVALIFDGGQLALIGVNTPAFATRSGARVGTSVSQLRDIYGPDLTSLPVPPGFKPYFGVLESGGPGGVFFDTDGESVTNITVTGYIPEAGTGYC